MNKEQGLPALVLQQQNQESTQMRLSRFRDKHEFSLQTVKATISHQLQVAALTTAQGEGEACYSDLRSQQGSPARKIQVLALQLPCLLFCRLNRGGGNFHLIQAQTCSSLLEVK